MKTNVGTTDRIIRIVAAIIFFALAFTQGGIWVWLGGILGVVMLLTAAVGFCPLYAPFGINTCGVKK